MAEMTTQLLPRTEALPRIRTLGKGRAVFLMCGQHAVIANEPGKVFPIMSSVKVPRNVAVQWVDDAHKHFEERGALVTLRWSERCLFIS